MPSYKDIANLSGLSTGTVSNVIQGRNTVKQKNVDSVMKAIETLNYRVNYQARSLSVEKSKMIGLVFASPENPTESKMLLKFEDLANRYDYQVLWATTRQSSSREKNSCEDMLSRQVDGLFVYSQSTANLDYYRQLSHTETTPIILVGRYFNNVMLPHVAVDNKYASRLMVEYLVSNGYKKVTYLDVLEEQEISPNRDRRKGILYNCEVNGIECNVINFNKEGLDYTTGYKAFENLMNSGKLPEIVIPRDDTFAVGFYNACMRYGVRVPEDISILSYGRMYEDAITPKKLTTYDPLFEKVVEKAFSMFLQLDKLPADKRKISIENEESYKTFIKGELIPGETVLNRNA